MEKIREAEKAELEGRLPRQVEGPQKVIRPAMDASTKLRQKQIATIGLIPGVYQESDDPRRDLADQPGYMPGVDLDEVWDSLSENQKIRAGSVERFRLEMETALQRASMDFEPPHVIGGRLDVRNLDRSVKNLLAEIDAFAYLLADDSKQLLHNFIASTREHIRVALRQNLMAGLEGGPLYDILRDWVHKLIYQELCSRRRAMGDRGIRRICANVELADLIYERLKAKPGYTVRQALLTRLVHVHQDIGHTAYAARVSYRGSKLHRAYGARIFTDDINRYRGMFTHAELEVARFAVATHSLEQFPFADNRVLAIVRAVDHLAPLAPHRVYGNLITLEGSERFLDDMLVAMKARDWDAFDQHKGALVDFMTEREVAPPLRDDVVSSLRAFRRMAEPVDLGALGGLVVGLDYDVSESPGALVATYQLHPWVQKYQVLFDYQQDQLMRLARETGVKAADVKQGGELIFQAEGMGALVLRQA